MRRSLALFAGVVVGVAACAAPATTSPSVRAVSPSPIPIVARVVCDGLRTRVLTPVVRLQRDGVEFSIRNVSDETLGFYPGRAYDDRPGMQGELAEAGN